MTSTRPDALVGERFRIESELGRGGMACVYRVLDERSGQHFALKKLLARGEQGSTLRAMFEREYHALVQLAHPNIVRVFEYGLDLEGPYYTMELLDGSNAREATHDKSLRVRQICSLLRDCAAALALIHSRRMIHRDVSPGNLWCTRELRGKLIDFGTLVAIGPQSRIAGTPPFVPPEAVYMQPLDARCDMYALGALAYFLLTQRHAYAARRLEELPDYWQRSPKRPHELVAELPSALSELVMAMLSLDARARPASAAEVYERLTALAELPVEDQQEAAQSFLTSPTLVGRDGASAAIAKRLRRAQAGTGSTLCISAPSGFGRSRVLSTAVLQAKLSGSVAVTVDASSVGSEPLRMAISLAERLVGEMPMLPATAIDLGPVLGNASATLHRAFGAPELAQLTGLERATKTSAALVALFEHAIRQRCVLIAVDDVQRGDGASLAVLGRLSLLAAGRALLLITTFDTSIQQVPPALERLLTVRHRVELAPLTAEQTHELLESVFGPVAGLDDAAAFIHELAAGSPQACMQYAQYLVDRRVARYERGQWQLPSHAREQGLPATLAEMLLQRISTLSDDALALALGLSLARDNSRSSWQPETHVHIEDFPKLIERGDAARAHAALDELLRAGIVQQRDSHYVLVQRAMVDALIRVAADDTRKKSHGRLAEIFTQPSYRAGWVAIQQLLAAGEYTRAREAIVSFGSVAATAVPDWGSMRVSLQVLCSHAAIVHWQTEGGSPKEGVMLRRVLLIAATVYDWSYALSHGGPQLTQLLAQTGLNHWSDTDVSLPALPRFAECLRRAQQEYDATPEAQRGLIPITAVRELCGCMMTLSRAYASAHDMAAANQLRPIIEAFRSLTPPLVLIADLCNVNTARVTGREFGDALAETAGRLLQTVEIPEVLRQGAAALNLHEQALYDARIGRKRALDCLGLIAAGGMFDELFIVLHGRWLSHAFLGATELAQTYRKRAEIITEDDVWRRKAYVFVEAEYYALVGDLQGLARSAAIISQLADVFPGWRPWLGFTRAAIHRYRGELNAAKVELEHAIMDGPAGDNQSWLSVAPAYAEVLLSLGDAAGAEREARATLERVEALTLGRACTVAALRVLALAMSEQQQHEAARQAVHRALDLARDMEFGGLPLACLYEAKAKIELDAGKPEACVSVLKDIWLLIERSHAPARINAYQVLCEESAKQMAGEAPALSSVAATSAESSAMYTEALTLLTAASSSHQRITQALQLILRNTGAAAGHLLLLDANGLFNATSIQLSGASAQMMREARSYLDTKLAEPDTVTQSGDELGTFAALFDGEVQLTPILLVCRRAEDSALAGLALIAASGQPRPPSGELVHLISRCLLAAGDSLALAVPE